MFHYMFHPPLKHIPIYEDAIQTLSIKKKVWRLVVFLGLHKEK
jgi:hypothetical protein